MSGTSWTSQHRGQVDDTQISKGHR
jgi:hypothetical protein